MLSAGIAITVLGGALSGAADPPAFPQIWYREVVLGEVAQAAQQYERLFLSPPSDRRPLSIRVKAAFRAGGCFERLGQPESAVLAYRWIESEAGRERDASLRTLVSAAALRRRAIADRVGDATGAARAASPAAAGDPASDPAVGSPGAASAAVAVRQLADAVRESERRLGNALVRLESELRVREERVAERETLVSRMESLGVTLLLPWAETLSPDVIRDGLRAGLPSFPDATRVQVESNLGSDALERAFLALVAGNEGLARDHFQIGAAILASAIAGSGSSGSQQPGAGVLAPSVPATSGPGTSAPTNAPTTSASTTSASTASASTTSASTASASGSPVPGASSPGSSVPMAWWMERLAAVPSGDAPPKQGRAREGLSRAPSSREGRHAELARRHLIDLELERVSALRRDLRTALDAADASLADRGRADVAAVHLARIRDLVDWSPAALREDVEVREIADRASRALESLVRHAGAGWELGRILERNRGGRERLRGLAADLVDVIVREVRLAGPTGLRGRPDALAVSRAEMDRLLLHAQSADARGDRLAAQRLLRDVETLLAWVPGIDPRSEVRGNLENLRRGDIGAPLQGSLPGK